MQNLYFTYKYILNKTVDKDNLFDKIYNDTYEDKLLTELEYPTYHTLYIDNIKETAFVKYQKENIVELLKPFKALLETYTTNISEHYTSFKIPKRNGKLRTIDAPDEDLKVCLRDLKDMLQNKLQIHPHNAAYAYIPKRCARHALEKHQRNESRWFLKIDLKDFFSNCTETFIHNQLKQIFPFNIAYTEKGLMQSIIKGAMLGKGLPQGTPFSPYITNIIMVPIDYAIQNLCKQYNKQHLIYTRYADDILISGKYTFDWQNLQNKIQKILSETTPLQINTEKTRYGSSSGTNWNLGLMLNKDNNITIGYRRKREIKQKLQNFCLNYRNWSKEDLQVFNGELAYFISIEPSYAEHILNQYSNKYFKNQDIRKFISKFI